MGPSSQISSDLLGLVVVVVGCFAFAGGVAASGLTRALKVVLISGLALRVVGAGIRYYVLFFGYDGVGDAVAYYLRSLGYADQIRQLDFSWLVDPSQFYQPGATWWGTQFVHVPAAFIMSLIGPTMMGVFVAFALAGFLGLLGFLVAFRNSFPDRPAYHYALLLFLFPSLWFWPTSLGKEALVLCGLGTAVAGYVGRRGRTQWPLLALGLALVFAVRPQVAGVAAVCMALAELLGRNPFQSLGAAVRSAVVIAFGVGLLAVAAREVGISEYDLTEFDSYIAESSSRRAGGDTDVEAVSANLSGAPIAIANVLFRPFVWESASPFVLVAALEIVGLWGLLLVRRARLLETLRSWPDNRLVRLAVIFVFLYSLALGLMVINVGVIARQRVFLIPFLFVLISETPLRAPANPTVRRAPRRRELPLTPLPVATRGPE